MRRVALASLASLAFLTLPGACAPSPPPSPPAAPLEIPPLDAGAKLVVLEQPKSEAPDEPPLPPDPPRPEPSAADLAVARKLFAEGAQAYGAGDFARALDRFRACYAIKAAPQVTYNIATALEKLGRNEEAAREYRKYLRDAPNAPNRQDVEARIKKLRPNP